MAGEERIDKKGFRPLLSTAFESILCQGASTTLVLRWIKKASSQLRGDGASQLRSFTGVLGSTCVGQGLEGSTHPASEAFPCFAA